MTGCGSAARPRVATRTRRLAYAVLAAVSVVVAVSAVDGCAAAPAPSASSASSTPPVVTVTEVDSGHTVALRPGQRLEVFLHSTAQSPWTAPMAEGPVLAPVSSGKLTLPVGVTAGAFQAARSGSARITSTRKLCPDAAPGQDACQGIQSFDLAVTVA